MGNIKILRGVFDTPPRLKHAGVAAGFPSPAEDYLHETLDYGRDYIRHPEASFYGDVEGDSMEGAGLRGAATASSSTVPSNPITAPSSSPGGTAASP